MRRSKAGGQSTKARRHTTATPKKHDDPKIHGRGSTIVALKADVAQLTVALNESREQQSALAEVLGAISRSRFELQPILESVVQTAMRLCHARQAVIFRLDGEVYRFAAGYSINPAYLDIERQTPISPGLGTLVGRAAMNRQVARIDDAWADALYEKKADAKLGEHRSMIGVPLMRDGEPIGVIGLSRNEVKPFSEHEIELVTAFADQAVIAIENSRLLSELRESLAQQTATAEVLQVINSSPGALGPVFEAMLEKAMRLCEANFGGLWTLEGERYRAVALRGIPAPYAAFLGENTIVPGPGTAPFRFIRGERLVHNIDLAAEEPYRKGDPQRRALVDLGGARTALQVPLRKEDRVLGVITIYRQEVRPFSDKQIELLTSFADQAVIAIENVRLLEAEQQRTRELTESLEQQTAMSEVLQVISKSPGDLKPIFASMLERAVSICDAKFGNLWLREEDSFRIGATYGAPPAWTEFLRREPVFRIDPRLGLGRLTVTKQTYQVADIAAQATYQDKLRTATIELAHGRSLIGVPLLRDDEVIGCIVIYRQEVRSFTDKQIALVENFAAQAVIAIENARLLSELRQRTDDLGRSVGELRALGEVSQAVNSTLDLQNVLETIVAKAVQLSETDAGAIYVFNEADSEFHLRATYAMDQGLIDALSKQHLRLDEANVGPLLTAREPIQIADLREDALNPINEITLRAGYRARLTAPLFRAENIVGMLVVRPRTPGAFPQNTVELMKTFAAQSAVAIQNARLYANVEARTQELAQSLADLQAAQNRLVQTEKLASLGQLTAGIAHEIKNPLNFVTNFSVVSSELVDELQGAIRGVEIDEKTRTEIVELTEMLRGNLEKVVQHGKRADSIVKNMLLHSREGTGEHRSAEVNALVEESLNLAYHGARADKQGFNITLERSFDATAGHADLFPQEITRVLLNLIANGFYAVAKRKAQSSSGYEPTLSAATRNLGDHVEIRIRDNGTGIPPEVREKMFNPFFTTKPAGEGTGLGLSLSYDIIVKQHSGSIEVDTQPGEFTEFRIVLPRHAAVGKSAGGG